ncbi:RNA polymerase subunit sigma [Bosea thiooxidans]|uniref:RNA polymerase sigma factor n=1 Tax=Bosea thiooxidans TaxID=53254 RepID=A0A0Q3M9R0_9HYPH|nr:RNA polymerase sigma factor [Bosea thiooxidans]KQK32529.1 RNA polymerase subunit sigma [Bosea thiooxidans]SKC10451.1 RNA polymerase sigma-70 factor, ECF subfamily [Bosea thiooxidans]
MPAVQNAPLIALAEEEAALIRRAAAGEVQAIRQIIRTHNQRLYRLVRAVLRSNADAEEVLQEAYLKAFANLAGFNGEASLATWLSRIALNAALMRLRAEKRLKRASPPSAAEAEIIPFPFSTATTDPERIMAQRQLLHLVEEATDALPEAFRLVFVARVIEGLSLEETAALLDLPPATVKTRLHRARKLIRTRLEAQIGPVLIDAFPFAGTRCDRLTEAVIAKLGLSE